MCTTQLHPPVQRHSSCLQRSLWAQLCWSLQWGAGVEGVKGWQRGRIQSCWGCFCSRIAGTGMTSTGVLMGTEDQNPCCNPVWPRIFTEMWSNFRMGFVITSLWVLGKSFRSAQRCLWSQVCHCHCLGQMGSSLQGWLQWCVLAGCGLQWLCFGEHLHCLWGAAERTPPYRVLTRGFHSSWAVFQSPGCLHVQPRWLWAPARCICQLHWGQWFAVAEGSWHYICPSEIRYGFL